MIADAELLRRHAEENAEDAFRELVARHLDFVYSAALRQVNGDTHLAQDVAQLVFTDLAQKAARLADRRVLAGWLFVSTRYAAAKLVRRERRRQSREQEAAIMENRLEPEDVACDWSQVRPVLDQALADLSETDREAILLRFFEGRAFAEVGERLRLTENTARMRVERALDKLRLRLVKAGVRSTTGALAVALAGQGVVAAPSGLVATVSGAALASAGMGVSSAVVMTFMSMSKLQLGILGAVAVTGTTGFMLQSQANSALTRELAALRQETRTATTAEVVRSTGKNEAGFDEQKARAYDAELRRLAAETAEVQKLNAANHAKMRAEAAVQTVKTPALSVAQLDRFPQVKARSAPTYPDELRQAGITGEVLVEFVVDGNGAVQGAFPVSSTHPDFEAAAVAAVEKWKFDAGLKGGRPVNTRLRQAITFSLAEATVPSSTWF